MPTPNEMLAEEVQVLVDEMCANPPTIDPACPTCGGKMWDQRAGYKGAGKKNAKAPDFKCRDKECLEPPDKSGKRWTTSLWMNNLDPNGKKSDWDDLVLFSEGKGVTAEGLKAALQIMGKDDWKKAKKSWLAALHKIIARFDAADPDDAPVDDPEDAAPQQPDEEEITF